MNDKKKIPVIIVTYVYDKATGKLTVIIRKILM